MNKQLVLNWIAIIHRKIDCLPGHVDHALVQLLENYVDSVASYLSRLGY